MKALTWHCNGDIRCESVPDPTIQHPRDAIIKVTACASCGSDLYLFDGVMPSMEKGDVLGHETMGEVVEVGSEISNLKVRGTAWWYRSRSRAGNVSSASAAISRLRAHQPGP
jgi:threonine dehydrogenase-like Zn-dependent dehydrogenase